MTAVLSGSFLLPEVKRPHLAATRWRSGHVGRLSRLPAALRSLWTGGQ